MDVECATAPVGDTELYYEVTGDGPWMVMAHGGGGNRIQWWQQVATPPAPGGRSRPRGNGSGTICSASSTISGSTGPS